MAPSYLFSNSERIRSVNKTSIRGHAKHHKYHLKRFVPLQKDNANFFCLI